MKAVVFADDGAPRLEPLTTTRPTAMLPVADAPVLEHVLDAATPFVDGFVIVVGHRPETVRRHFDAAHAGVPIEYVSVADRPASAHAIARAAPHLDGTTLVIPGDRLLSRGLLERLVTGRPPAIAVVSADDPSPAGAQSSDDRDHALPRKAITRDTAARAPECNTTAIAYLLSARTIEAIESDTGAGTQSGDLRAELERRQPTGTAIRIVHGEEPPPRLTAPWELLEATADVIAETGSAIDGRVGHTATLLGRTRVETGARVRNGTYLEGPVTIRSGADVGPNAFLRGPVVVGPNVRVENAVELEHSICMAGATVGHQSTIRHSIVGAEAAIGANTTVENRPLESDTVTMALGDEPVDTGRERLGVVVGDAASTAIGTNLGAGVVLGPEETTAPGETRTVDGN